MRTNRRRSPVTHCRCIDAVQADKRVNEDHTPIEIVSKRGNAVLVSKEDWDSIVETNYLLRSPANAKHLMESVEQWRAGRVTERDLDLGE